MRDSTVKSLHIELEEKNEQNEEISYRSSSPYSISLNDVRGEGDGATENGTSGQPWPMNAPPLGRSTGMGARKLPEM